MLLYSGSLEQDADIVVFIYRKELYDEACDAQGPLAASAMPTPS